MTAYMAHMTPRHTATPAAALQLPCRSLMLLACLLLLLQGLSKCFQLLLLLHDVLLLLLLT